MALLDLALALAGAMLGAYIGFILGVESGIDPPILIVAGAILGAVALPYARHVERQRM